MKAYVGLDWSSRELVAATCIGDEPVKGIKGAERTPDKVSDLVARVRARHPKATEVHVVIEAGATGWVQYLHEAGAIVHVVDPQKAKAFGQSLCSSRAKDDRRDAEVLAEMGRTREAKLPRWAPASELKQQLTALSSVHETLTCDQTRIVQRLRSLIREGMAPLESVLGDLKAGWVWRLLRVVPTPWHAEKLTEVEFRTLMKKSGARGVSLDKVLKALGECTAPWLTEAVARTQGAVVAMYVEQIELLSRQLRETEKQLDALTSQLRVRELLMSVDGIADKMFHRLLEFAFDIDVDVTERTPRDQAGIALGACPVFQGSGKTRGGTPKGWVGLRRSTAPGARSTGYLLGRLASQQLDWAAAMYADAKKRGQRSATAYRRIARCLLRILTAMLRTGQPYDNDKYVRALKAKGVPWAAGLTVAAA